MEITYKRFGGYIFGAQQQSVALTFNLDKEISTLETKLVDKLYGQIQKSFQESIYTDKKLNREHEYILKFVSILEYLNNRCGDLRYTDITIDKNTSQCIFFIPTLSPALMLENIKILLNTITNDNHKMEANLKLILEQCNQNSRSFFPSGTNIGNFISSAAERKIPFKVLSRKHVVFNYGKNSIIFNSSIIEDESSIGVALSKSKIMTHQILRQAGIPVANQARISNFDQCKKFSTRFDFPVVIKPEDEDQGVGVFADIRTDDELETCYRELSNKFDSLIIENHVPGNVYRINVFKDRVIRAVHRQHPFVTGDGISSVGELIQRENKDPDRLSIHSSKKLIKTNDETLRTLAKSNFHFDSVPKKGEVIKLSAGLDGGTSMDALGKIHDDNIQLCIEAAQTMRVSMCGVDFISLDPSVPWYKNDAIICEVNSQPQLGSTHPEIYRRVLNSYMNGYPHISIFVSNKFSKIISPILNKSLGDIKIKVSPKYLLQNGCPSQYFHALYFEEDVSSDDQEAIKRKIKSIFPDIEVIKLEDFLK